MTHNPNFPDNTNDSDKPWDVKTLKLSLGGEDDERGFITFQVFDDYQFCIYQGCEVDHLGGNSELWHYEDIHIDAARRLRDFLNYAVPK